MIKILIIILSFNVILFAKEQLIKECRVEFNEQLNGKRVNMNFKILSENQKVNAQVKMKISEFDSEYVDSVSITEYNIRKSTFDPNYKANDLNFGEKALLLALELYNNLEFKNRYKLDIDLFQVAKVTIFLIGKETLTGSTYLVEAKSQNSLLLGTFLGGYLMSPCIK